MAHLLQVGGQAVIEVLHGQLLIGDHCCLAARDQWPGGVDRLRDVAPETSRAPVHAGRAARHGAGDGDAALAFSDRLHPAAQAESAAAGDAAGAVAAGLAGDRDRHGERWLWRWTLAYRWRPQLESLRGVSLCPRQLGIL